MLCVSSICVYVCLSVHRHLTKDTIHPLERPRDCFKLLVPVIYFILPLKEGDFPSHFLVKKMEALQGENTNTIQDRCTDESMVF